MGGHISVKNLYDVNMLTKRFINHRTRCMKIHFTCMFISHGGGAPSGIPRASLSSRDRTPGFISLSLTCNVLCTHMLALSPVPGPYEQVQTISFSNTETANYLKLLSFIIQVTMTSQFWLCLIFEESVM